jgi:hypothetical protein
MALEPGSPEGSQPSTSSPPVGGSSPPVGGSSPPVSSSSAAADVSADPNVLPPDSVRAVQPINEADVRAYLAFILAGIFSVTILIAFALVSYQLLHSTATVDAAGKVTTQAAPVWDPAKELIANLLSAEVGLFGTVLGFYFGGKAAQDKGTGG